MLGHWVKVKVQGQKSMSVASVPATETQPCPFFSDF